MNLLVQPSLHVAHVITAQLQWYVRNFDLIWPCFLRPHISARFGLWALKTIWEMCSSMLGPHEKVKHATHQLVVAIVTSRVYHSFKVGRTALQLMQVWQVGTTICLSRNKHHLIDLQMIFVGKKTLELLAMLSDVPHCDCVILSFLNIRLSK